MMELRCTRDLALRLGAVEPASVDQHKGMKNAGHLLIRDPATSFPLFWPLVAGVGLIARSS